MNPTLDLFPVTTTVAGDGDDEQLVIAGCRLADLAAAYGTPLYLYDAATLHTAVSAYRHALAAHYPGPGGVTYAGKAYLCLAIAQWTQQHALWLDCTGLGELHIARAAGVPRAHILLHGVNKSRQVLQAGVAQAGTLVVDNLTELHRLAALAETAVSTPLPALWLRFRPGEAVTTHAHIQTGQADSKFGMDAAEIAAAAALCRAHALPLSGLHFHLGSQFRDPAPVAAALARTLDLAARLPLPADWSLCPGGGLGAAYAESDLPHPDVAAYVRFIAETVVAGCRERNLPLPRLQLEPGRSLVARAGVALYRVGTVKHSAGRRWLLLDGGLADNPRPALYRARYAALPVQQPRRADADAAWLAGPYCETGDRLIDDLPFPNAEPGDLVAIPTSGAYQLSMASNYNGAGRPAVLWLAAGAAHLIQARETAADLLRRDRPLPGRQAQTAVHLSKYHAAGNDYLVLSHAALGRLPTPAEVRRLCHRQHGPGADGLLVDCSAAGESDTGRYSVRIFNPDGSEAEKSGNGLRIFARWLWEQGRVSLSPFVVQTPGGPVTARVHADGNADLTVQMGQVSFDSRSVPVTGPPREVLGEPMSVAGTTLFICAVSLGNPHCVVLNAAASAAEARRLGPHIETDARFPARTNVQFMTVRDRTTIQLEIWERGAGYTLSSGSSSCAAAAVARRLGLCAATVTVQMPGGALTVEVSPEYAVALTGPVAPVWRGAIISATEADAPLPIDKAAGAAARRCPGRFVTCVYECPGTGSTSRSPSKS